MLGLGAVLGLAVVGLVVPIQGSGGPSGSPAALRPALTSTPTTPTGTPKTGTPKTGTPKTGTPKTGTPAPTRARAKVSPSTHRASKSPTVQRFASCATLRQEYPHGVGRRTAKDHASGTPVTTFTRNAKVYAANTARDGDGDGIACERP